MSDEINVVGPQQLLQKFMTNQGNDTQIQTLTNDKEASTQDLKDN